MEPNEAGDNNSEILRDIDDIIKVNASSLMPNDHLNFNLQQTSPHHPTLSEAAPSSTASSFYNPVHKDLPPSEKPYIRIIEQPTSKAFRFRYQCEGRSAGSIPGANSTNDRKTYPTIEIVGYSGEAAIVVSCVTKDEPYRPHPHNLVGKEGCKDGVFTMKLKSGALRVVFNNLGIQCARKKDIHASLSLRELQKVDPFKTKFSHKDNPSSIDLNAVRLCFQAFIKVDNERVALKPVVSDPIFKKPAELVITRLCSCSAKVGGGDEKILLCEKVLKEDIKVKFYEIENDVVKWEAFAYFNQVDVHKQTAIAFRTPRYHSAKVKDNSKVYIQLYRPSDGMTSEPKEFEFYPDPGMRNFSRLQRKLKRKEDVDIFEKILSMDSEVTKKPSLSEQQNAENDTNNTIMSDGSASTAHSSQTLNDLPVSEQVLIEGKTQPNRANEDADDVTDIEIEVPDLNYPLVDDSTQTSSPIGEVKHQQFHSGKTLIIDKVCEWMRTSEFERADCESLGNVNDSQEDCPHKADSRDSDLNEPTELMERIEQAQSICRMERTASQVIDLDNDADASVQVSVDIDEAFDENSTSNSLKFALRNPIRLPQTENERIESNTKMNIEEDILLVMTSSTVPTMNPAESTAAPHTLPLPLTSRVGFPIHDTNLPPLPPKPTSSHALASEDQIPINLPDFGNRNSNLSSPLPPSQIIIMRTPDHSPQKRSDTASNVSPRKKQGFFSRFFSRRKSKADSSPGDEFNSRSPTTPNLSRESSIDHTSINRGASFRSVKSDRPASTSNSYGYRLSSENLSKRSNKSIDRSYTSVSSKRTTQLNPDVIHIPLKAASSSSLASPQFQSDALSNTLSVGHTLDRKTLSALQLADIPFSDGKMELLAIADRQSIKNLCEGSYGVVLDPSVDLSEAEHFALYTSVSPEVNCPEMCDGADEHCESQIISPVEIARRLAEANGL